MIFLIEYDRERGKLVRIKEFDGLDRAAAEKSRLNLELDLSRAGTKHEVVLLEAENEAALRLTHSRYFDSVQTIAASISQKPDFGEPAKP